MSGPLQPQSRLGPGVPTKLLQGRRLRYKTQIRAKTYFRRPGFLLALDLAMSLDDYALCCAAPPCSLFIAIHCRFAIRLNFRQKDCYFDGNC